MRLGTKILLKVTLLIIFLLIVFSSCSGGRKDRNMDVLSTKANEEQIPAVDRKKPDINVYIENSGSMDGYVTGVTDFEAAIYNYLSDIKIAGIGNSLNLNYINSKVIPQGNAMENNLVLQDFISKLEPTTFRQKGGNRSVSDLSEVLRNILENTDSDNVSVFISDCIFSPGKNVNADNYLQNQQIGIKVNMAEKIAGEDIGIVIYQMESVFDGKYFNKSDRPVKIKEKRPYYIWLIGNRSDINVLLESPGEKSFDNRGLKNKLVMLNGSSVPEYAVSPSGSTYKKDKKNPKTSIYGITKQNKGPYAGRFMCRVGIDLKDFPLDESYLLNAGNYELNDPDYKIEVTKSSDGRYTHTLILSSDIIKPTELSIRLKRNIPQWIYDTNDDIGEDLVADNAMDKTYGFKYLIQGIEDAFRNYSDEYFKIKISIKN